VRTNTEVDKEIRKWIRDHDGVISRDEALRLGASRSLIHRKFTNGEWLRVHPGVYRSATAPPTPYQELRAAYVALVVGVVSHLSAGWVWGLLTSPPSEPHLSVRVGEGASRLRGVVVHRSTDLDPQRAVLRHGLLVTNPLRTVVDLAGLLTPVRLAAVVDAGLASRLITIDGLLGELQRLSRPGRLGVGPLRLHLQQRGFVGAPSSSVLESKMLRILVATGLPLPTVELSVNADGSYRLDFAWPSILLTIEVDGYIWHFSPEQKQRDDLRRNRLQRAGWLVQVYDWRQVCDEPRRLVNEITRTYNERAALHAP
jgi:hypothetical protein